MVIGTIRVKKSGLIQRHEVATVERTTWDDVSVVTLLPLLRELSYTFVYFWTRKLARLQVGIAFREQALVKGNTLCSYLLIDWMYLKEFKEGIFGLCILSTVLIMPEKLFFEVVG